MLLVSDHKYSTQTDPIYASIYLAGTHETGHVQTYVHFTCFPAIIQLKGP